MERCASSRWALRLRRARDGLITQDRLYPHPLHPNYLIRTPCHRVLRTPLRTLHLHRRLDKIHTHLQLSLLHRDIRRLHYLHPRRRQREIHMQVYSVLLDYRITFRLTRLSLPHHNHSHLSHLSMASNSRSNLNKGSMHTSSSNTNPTLRLLHKLQVYNQ